ncbi:hypothetical protein [Nitrosovibrio sp. Nv17]|uniref:hypothetical protein n=1 Tax=Nitrosovibrio sp. Nv17 TaxID=1855339 RepID=UPI000908C29E|nr:hypothetical protein [Nitrosovibrio sp. Nv17]SFW29870.1 hypothetical protein SAMN05216414_11333 [Nitrosovibrio sp. Nv17]
MLIQNVRRIDNDERTSVIASVTYEQRQADTQDISVSIPASHASLLGCSYEAFLLMVFSAALFHREERIHVEGPACPVLMNNLRAAMRLQRNWFQPADPLPVLSAAEEKVNPGGSVDRKVGAFYSGGIDSTAALLSHAWTFDTEHREALEYAFLVYGLDIGDPSREPGHELFDHALRTQGKVASELGIEMVPIWTNVRLLEPDSHLYARYQFGAILSGIAHCMSQCIRKVHMAYNNIIDMYEPWGDHPTLVPLLSSTHLAFSGALLHLTRFEKLAIIARSETALSNLRVCWNTDFIPDGYLNCGRCEKCLRTKLELLAIGIPEMGVMFPDSRIDPDMLRSLHADHFPENEYYRELIEPLHQRGYHELSDIIRLITRQPTTGLWPSYARMMVKRRYWKMLGSLQDSSSKKK